MNSADLILPVSHRRSFLQPWSLAAVLFTLLLPGMARAQFTLQSGLAGITSGQAVSRGEAVFADFDGDQDLDLIVSGRRSGGTSSTRLYLNNGLNLVWVLTAGLDDLQNSRMDVGDYDNNGTMDLVITGDNSGNGVTKVFRNSGLPGFISQTSLNVNIPQVSNGDVAWGDYDNDGDLDLLVTGIPATSPTSTTIKIIENQVPQGGGFLEDAVASGGLVGLKNSSIAWVDYDLDGRLDIVLSGQNASNQSRTYLYKNLGNSQFALVPTANFQDVAFGTVSQADMNNDGYPDIVLCGADDLGNRYLQVYLNQVKTNPIAPFTLSQSLTGITNGKAVPFDYDNDGWVDLIAAGQDGANNNSRTTVLYRNDQTGNLVSVSAGLNAVNDDPALAVGDFSFPADGKVDLFVSGLTSSPNSINYYLWENSDPGANDKPDPPTGLTANVVGSTVQFSWNRPFDYVSGVNAGLAGGLSYELSIGTLPNDDDLDPAHAEISGGKRFIQTYGMIKDTTWTISGLPANPNYWVRVQAIDAGLEGSVFSSAVNFSVVNVTPALSVYDDSTTFAFGSPPPTGPVEGYVSWCDCNNDGYQDVLYGGNQSTFPSLTNFTGLYQNNGDGTFLSLPVQSAAIPDIYQGDVSWGDANNDGLLDLLICGVEDVGVLGTSIARVYLNTGNCQMGSAINLGVGVSQGSVDWGDVDSDGDMDILLTGKSATGDILRVYLNNFAQTGTVSFTNSSNAFTGAGVELGSARFGDYDNDGDLDFAVSGLGTSGNLTRIYQNDGDGIFTALGSSIFTGVKQSSVVWIDMDNDGYLELIVAGNEASSGLQTSARVYKYYPSIGTLLSLNVPGITGGDLSIANGSMEAGDYDNDGLMDLLVTGRSGNNVSSAPRSAILKNQGNLSFSEELLATSNLVDVSEASQATFGDYNNDHKLDVLMVGLGAASNKLFKLYRNVEPTANTSPAAPHNSKDTLLNFEVELSWAPPAGPASYPGRVNGYSYELYIDGPASGGMDKMAAHSDLSSGFRRVIHIGNGQLNQSYRIRDLAPGTYSWGVQAIDQDYEGSPFLSGGTFTYQDPTFVQVNSTLFPNNDDVGMSLSAMAWSDYQSDGYLDLVVSGKSDVSTYSTILYQYDPLNDIFLEDPFYSGVLEDVSEGDFSWGDFDNDGDLDLAMTGNAAGGPVTRVYINISGGFTTQDTLEFPGLGGGAIQWVDANNDGFLDLLYTGHETNGTGHTYLYRNTGQGSFSQQSGPFFQAANGDIAIGDVDKNGYPDIVISGSANTDGANGLTRLYLNQGDFSFSYTPVSVFPGFRSSSLAIGDVDANGFPDIVVAGIANNGNHQARYLENSDGSTWTFAQNLGGIGTDDVQIGDYNDDGYPDLVALGNNGTVTPGRSLYSFNSSSGLFELEDVDGANIPPLGEGASAAWGDFDQDGKLDLVTLGIGTGGRQMDLLQNLDPTANFTPGKPRTPMVQIIGEEVVFSWQEPANVATKTFRKGISYQVYVGTTSGGIDQLSPMSDLTNGTRRIVAWGQVYDTTSFRMANLPAGSYFWGVQAIDTDYEGSLFETGPQFDFELPTFEDVTTTAFSAVPDGFSEGDLAWADADLDGDLDLAVAGNTTSGPATSIYLNNSGVFSAAATSLTGVYEAAVHWADVNGDNRPDLFVAGRVNASTNFTEVYLNQSSGNFVAANASLPALHGVSVASADLDRDGDMDLVMSGNNASGPVCDVYWNNGGGVFTPASAGLTAISGGSVHALDLTGDAITDLLVTGANSGSTWTLKLYKGLGNGDFQEITSGVGSIVNARASFADYDGDGDPDMALVGGTATAAGRVYLNNGAGFFTLGPGVNGVIQGDLQWGDLDENGRPDLLVMGNSGSGNIASYYRNGTSGLVKSPIATLPIKLTSDTDIALGDFTGDGKLDLAAIGVRTTSPLTRAFRLYENIETSANQPPGAPTGLTTAVSGDTLILSWTKPSGSTVVTNGYTYQVSIGTANEGTDIVSPLSDAPGGWRRIVSRGEQGQETTWKIIGLPSDTYYWGVQTVDQDYEGSGFAYAPAVNYSAPNLIDWNAEGWSTLPTSGVSLGDIAWADFDGDGNLDLAVAGEEENGFPTLDIYSQKFGNLALDNTASQNLQAVENATLVWEDIDLDGDPDLIVAGQVGNTGTNYQTRLYRNNNGSFVNVAAFMDSVPQVRFASLAFADVDLDGDPDLAITGETASGLVGGIYLNDGGTFSLDPRRPIQAVKDGSLEWGDFDRDGDPDLVLTGANGVTLYSQIYRNRAERGDFVALTTAEANLIKIKEGVARWADYDNDGDLDLLLSGETSPTQVDPRTRLYAFNATNGTFSLVNGVSITGFRSGDAQWGDINDDGWLDLLIGGKFGAQTSDRRTALYLGASNGTFTLDQATTNHLRDADDRAAFSLGDFDNDGKLDAAVIGRIADSSPRRTFTLYRNVNSQANTTPGAPRTPVAQTDADSVRLSWLIPLGLIPATAQGISYNVEVRKTSGGRIVSPLADVSNGYRKVPMRGNAGNRNFLTLRGLETGQYEFVVQAIDHDLEGGPFSVTGTFNYTAPSFVNVSGKMLNSPLPGITEGDAAWGDVDADGDLDLILTGRTQAAAFFTELYENEGNHSLVPLGAVGLGLPALRQSAVAWQDIDGDGDLDLAISGLSASGAITRVYTWDGSQFQLVNSSFEGVTDGDLAWIDADRDGDPDLLVGGVQNGTRILSLYTNETGLFTKELYNWPTFEAPAITVGDVNLDGFQDFVVAGNDGANPRVTLFLGDEVTGFDVTDVLAATDIEVASLMLMDVDHDGTPDLLMSGTDANGDPSSQILTNDGTGFFTASASPDPLHLGALLAADLNEDGFSDVLISGENSAGQETLLIYRSQGGTGFQRETDVEADFVPVSGDVILAQGDFTGDGQLDLLLSGNDGSADITYLYRNDWPLTNRVPGVPENLDRSIVGSTVILSWDPPSSMTPSERAGLTYNVKLTEQASGIEVVHGMAATDGFRSVASHGNAGQRLELPVSDLKTGEVYRWSVQAIGQDYEGSAFSPEDSFSFDPPAFDDKTSVVFNGDPPVPVAEARIALGDYDADGDLDLIAVGETESGVGSVDVFRNETTPANGGRFVKDTLLTESLTAVRMPALAWEDVNGDGYLDLLLAGKQDDSTSLTTLYLYDNGVYTAATTGTEEFPDVYDAMAGWADYDLDGDVDLALAGTRDDGTRFTGIFEQVESGVWKLDPTALGDIDNFAVTAGDLAWGDFDKDGDMDLAMAGTSDIGPVTRVLKNNGEGKFSIGLYSELVPAKNSRLAWGDFNNDGDLDLLVTGDNSTQADFVPVTVVYEYLAADDRFTEFLNQDFEDLTQGSANWGDFNNDGWLDILISGKYGAEDSARSTRLYRNQGGASFIEDINTSGDLVNVDLGAAAWGDYNGDKKLDVFLTGRTASNPATYTFLLFENIDTLANVTPVQPLDPSTRIEGREITFSWDSPNHLPAALRNGLTYNLMLYKVGEGSYLTSPQADTSNGYRQVVRNGNIGHQVTWTLRDLEDGEYVWRVQTVDQDFEGSAFSDPIRFSFKNPIPKIVSSTYPELWEEGGTDVTALIEIDDPDIIDEVIVFYKGIASADWNQTPAGGSGDTWDFTINQASADEMGVEYVFQVIGKYGYDAFSDTGYTYRRYPQGFDMTGLRNGKRFDDYDIIAIPLDLENNGVAQVIEEYGEYNNRKWRLWHYGAGTLNEYTESSFNSFEPGKGYWLISKDPMQFNTGAGRVVEANDAHPFQISLTQGFNQLGSPFPFAVSWDDILAANSQEVVDQLEDVLAYETAYNASDRLKFLRGGFVFAHQPVTINIPVRKNNNIQRSSHPRIPDLYLEEPVSSVQWFLPMDARVGDKVTQLGGFGMAPNASEGRDPLDRMAPPRFGDFVEMSVSHPDYFYPAFTRDIQPASKAAVWEFTVKTNLDDPMLELSWDLDYLPNDGLDWKLMDVDNQRIVDIREVQYYRSVSEQKVRHFRLFAGTHASLEEMMVADRIHLGMAYPNPAETLVQIPVSLPPSAEPYDLHLIVMNQLGQEIANLPFTGLQPGFYEVEWDGMDRRGRKVSAGMYLYRLEVNGKMLSDQAGKMQWR